jgi:hypothetical protein
MKQKWLLISNFLELSNDIIVVVATGGGEGGVRIMTRRKTAWYSS